MPKIAEIHIQKSAPGPPRWMAVATPILMLAALMMFVTVQPGAGPVYLFAWLLVAGLADNVLKPLFLGRGVDAPMPVILLGALGGMVHNGIQGMFVGAVVLAIGYQLLMRWIGEGASQE